MSGTAGPSPGADLLTALGLQVGLCLVLAWRVRAVPHELTLWRRLSVAAMVVTAALVTTAVLGPLTGDRAVADIPVTCAPVLTFPLLYGGLVRWNRYSIGLADRTTR